MNKKYFSTLIVAVVAMFAGYNMYQSQRTVTMSDLILANIEALAEDYEIGTPGTNWKTYSTECTITRCITAGISCGVLLTCSHQVSYDVIKDFCGKGSGACLSSAGC